MIYHFIDNYGTFRVNNPYKISYLYFPLTNKDGTLLSSISPNLAGDIKKDNDRFLTPPATVEDIKNNPLCRRDFFIRTKDGIVYQASKPFPQEYLECGFLYHKLVKENELFSLEILNFIPFDLDAEVMWIKIRGKKKIKITPTSFLPLYGRGEKSLRDHRHVTSLLNRVELKRYGIILKPTMIFDERKHRENTTLYFAFAHHKSLPPLGQFPTLLTFCGEEGNLEKPQAVYRNLKPFKRKQKNFDGKESCAAFRFRELTIRKGEEVNFFVIMGIAEDKQYMYEVFNKLNSQKKIKLYLEKTKSYWQKHLSSLRFDFKNKLFNNWLLWVYFQPTLRKLWGCSFLPHFDYGKGGRGWRDLWQDILSLILRGEKNIDKLILNNLKGIRIDGSNATIITREGKFISDRNRISRVWTDHGVWPLLAIELYLNYSENWNLLFKKIPYFRDHQLKRAKEIDLKFKEGDFFLRTKRNKIYKGTVLEHLLVQNLVQFFNVGDHNILKLENADWNDGLDCAPDKGESVPFYCMYGYNLKRLGNILEEIAKRRKEVELLKEITFLLDRLNHPIDYNNANRKREILSHYLEKTKYKVSGKKVRIETSLLARDLKEKGEWIYNYIRKKEWLKEGFFNGYYDNRGRRVEGKREEKVRLLLQSQVFPIISGVATSNQIKKIITSVNRYLKDKKLGGLHLNTNFEAPYLELGRAFGFSYGDKENGAFFNHMVVLFAYGLYKRGFIEEGFKTLHSIYKMSTSKFSKIYPMIPEYFNLEGRGLYFYLTGSASWYIYTIFEEVMGINFFQGDLLLQPKLTNSNFFKNSIEMELKFQERKIKIIYQKTNTKKFYNPKQVIINGHPKKLKGEIVKIPKEVILSLPPSNVCMVKLLLG
ncbi:MAG: cellobiose phosphorylase [Candidatus Omnitrophota bacterium]|nr:MAG: cellobiose phosphorylase [Candidatus Omnitrophota bacterium]